MTDDALPGSKSTYFLRCGMGERYLLGGQLTTLLARPEDTGGLLEAAVVSGGADASFAPHLHVRTHESLYVLDGQLELHLAGKCYLLTRGDYANIPPDTMHGYRMRGHATRLLMWSVRGDMAKLFSTLGEPYERFVYPDGLLASGG